MRKQGVLLFVFGMICVVSVGAQDLPGMGQPVAESIEPELGERIDTEKVIDELSPMLKFSSRQEERVRSAIRSEEQKYRKIEDRYQQARSEERKWRVAANDLKYELNKTSKNVPDIVRPLLDPEQRELYDKVLEAKKMARAGPPVMTSAPAAVDPSAGAAPAVETAVPQSAQQIAPVKKKKRVIRRKKIAGAVAPVPAGNNSAQPQSPPVTAGPDAGQQSQQQPEGVEEVPSGSYP